VDFRPAFTLLQYDGVVNFQQRKLLDVVLPERLRLANSPEKAVSAIETVEVSAKRTSFRMREFEQRCQQGGGGIFAD
jgi:hypothetical protein